MYNNGEYEGSAYTVLLINFVIRSRKLNKQHQPAEKHEFKTDSTRARFSSRDY